MHKAAGLRWLPLPDPGRSQQGFRVEGNPQCCGGCSQAAGLGLGVTRGEQGPPPGTPVWGRAAASALSGAELGMLLKMKSGLWFYLSCTQGPETSAFTC